MNELFERKLCRIDSSTFLEKWQIQSNTIDINDLSDAALEKLHFFEYLFFHYIRYLFVHEIQILDKIFYNIL
jgi:hypothetical protein